MTFDPTVTISVIIALIALISPIVTTLINNDYQLKLKKLDMYEDAKRKTLTEFIECAEDYLLNNNYVEQNVKYYSSMNKLFVYFSNIHIDLFIEFEKNCRINKTTEATVALTNIVQILSKQITKE